MTYVKTNLHRRLNSHCSIIFNRKTEESGTGVLVEFRGKYFILTAWHLLKDTANDDILINLGIQGQRYPMKKEKIWYDKKLDIAYIKLNEFEANFLRAEFSEPFPIEKLKIRDIVKDHLRCAISGFPKENIRIDKSGKLIKLEIILVTSFLIPPEKWPSGIVEDGKVPGLNFLLNYGEKFGGRFQDQEGMAIFPTDPQGLSGAAVWLFDPKTENESEPDYGLFGIQTGFYKQSQLLVGTSIEPLVRQISSDYSGSFPLIESQSA